MRSKVEPAFQVCVTAAVLSGGLYTCSGSGIGCGILLRTQGEMLATNDIAHMIEQLARPPGLRKLLFLFRKAAYFGRTKLSKMPTVLLHLPPILEATPRNRQKSFCLLRC